MTASFDMTRCSHVLAELIRLLCRYLTLDSKGIRESQQYCRRGIALIVEATREARRSEPLALLQGSGRLVHHTRSKSAYENNIVRWGQKRSRTSSACSVGTSAGIVVFRITRSQGARHNTTDFWQSAASRIILVAGCVQNPFRCEKAPQLYFSCSVWQLNYGKLGVENQ